jgi:hypothetical protein
MVQNEILRQLLMFNNRVTNLTYYSSIEFFLISLPALAKELDMIFQLIFLLSEPLGWLKELMPFLIKNRL